MRLSTLLQSLLFGSLIAFSYTANAVSVSWGALATGSISSCDDPFCLTTTTISEESAGDDMAASATTNLDSTTDPNIPAGNSSFAEANFSDTATEFTPVLRASATADSDHLAVSTASGIQGYINSGPSTTLTLQLELTVSEVTGLFSGVGAFAAVFLTDVLEITGETIDDAILGTGFDTAAGSTSLAAISGVAPPSQVIDFDFDVPIGENFLLWAGLQAFTTNGTAIAENTLTMRLFDENGQPVLFDPTDVASEQIGVIPLPPSVWLFLSGIWVIGSLAHYRKSRATG